jgi:hypothetical protein
MTDKFKKIDKEFCITDSSVNVYKYRCLTEGLQLDEVQKNPIGYYLHGTEEYPRESGVLVRWEDFRKDGDKILAKPCINLSHPRGKRTVDEIEIGFLNAASVGKIVVLEASDDPQLKVFGQDKPTIVKWFPREISLVDIPGNYNALANLYDKDNNELNLSDLREMPFKNPPNPVDITKVLQALSLKDGSESEILKAIGNLTDKAKLADEYGEELRKMKTEEKYKGKTWDDLYRSDELETVRQKFPKLYEKLKTEKFPNIKS